MELPPRDPVIYRLFEIVQVYGYAYKNIIAEKFGDGIMSAISFSTSVEREEDDKGTWVKVFYNPPFIRSGLTFRSRKEANSCRTPGSKSIGPSI